MHTHAACHHIWIMSYSVSIHEITRSDLQVNSCKCLSINKMAAGLRLPRSIHGMF